MTNKIDVTFCISNNYTGYISVTIKSICEIHKYSDSYININVISDYISTPNQEKLLDLIKEYDKINISFYFIDNSRIRNIEYKSYTEYAWYRILLPYILPKSLEKTLYLDADTIVNGNLTKLYNTDITNKAIGAVLDPNNFDLSIYKRLNYDPALQYVCSGILLINLNYWRNHSLPDKIIEWADNNRFILKYPDQDAINYICKDSKVIIPLKFGLTQWHILIEEFYNYPYISELEDAIKNPVIIHFAFTLPWYKDAQRHIFNDLWITYNKKLRSPVKRRYMSKGIICLKIMIWNLFHPKGKKPGITKEEILNKIKEISPKI